MLDALSSGWATRTFGITRTTLKRWREVGIPPARFEEVSSAIRALTHEKAPPGEPDGASDELLRLWTAAKPPLWAIFLTDQIKDMLKEHRALLEGALKVATEEQGDELMRRIDAALDEALDEAERKRGERSDDEAPRVPSSTEPDEADEPDE